MSDQSEINKLLVCEFYNLVFNERKVRLGFERYVAVDYIQHNPMAAQGRESAIDFIERILKNVPKRTVKIVRTIAEDDLVALHIHVREEPEDLGDAHADFFRVENGIIVEHWDVIQPVPQHGSAQNVMFSDGIDR